MTLASLSKLIDALLDSHLVPELSGVRQTIHSQVTRLGLALELDPLTDAWAQQNRLDALWLHRIRPSENLPSWLSIISHHAAYDRRFGLAANPDVWHLLGGNGPARLLSDRPALSVIALKQPITPAELAQRLRHRFGGIERLVDGRQPVTIVALADGMRPELVAAAASAGAQAYVTGQWRPNAEQALEKLGLSLMSVGHERQERAGLTDLAQALHVAHPELAIIIKP